MFSRPKILFLVSLLFVALLNSISTYLLNFEFFYQSMVLQFDYTAYTYEFIDTQHYIDMYIDALILNLQYRYAYRTSIVIHRYITVLSHLYFIRTYIRS